MKATIEIPDELYRRVKAKSALEGRPVRAVTEELFRRYVTEAKLAAADAEKSGPEVLIAGEAPPPWFGILGEQARQVEDHDIESIRASIARGLARDRRL